jgi:hypothetical protein
LEGRDCGIQNLYEVLQQTSDGVSHFLELTAGSKRAQLLALESIKDQKLAGSGSAAESAANSEAASLLHVTYLIAEQVLQSESGDYPHY